jgi:hypothetical protein
MFGSKRNLDDPRFDSTVLVREPSFPNHRAALRRSSAGLTFKARMKSIGGSAQHEDHNHNP